MELELFDLLLLVSFAQGLIFGIMVIVSPTLRQSPSLFLGIGVMLISIIGANLLLSNWGFDDRYYFIDYAGDDLPWILLFYVPILIFFLRSVDHPYAKRPQLGWLVLPFVVYAFLNLFVNFQVDFGWYQFDRMSQYQDWIYTSESIIAILYTLGLSIWAYRVVRQSSLDHKEQKNLLQIWGFMMILLAGWILYEIVPPTVGLVERWIGNTLWLGVSTFIYWLTYRRLFHLQSADMAPTAPLTSPVQLEAPQPSPIKKTAPGFRPDHPTFVALEKRFSEQERFRDPQLTREIIAEELGISPGYLSQLIKSITSNSFSYYLNQYRVEAVKKMLHDPKYDAYSLLAVGQEAGFTSRSAFFTSFKKFTGMTPKAFKESSDFSELNI